MNKFKNSTLFMESVGGIIKWLEKHLSGGLKNFYIKYDIDRKIMFKNAVIEMFNK